jgi:hypothetical protein
VAAHQENIAKPPLKAQTGWSSRIIFRRARFPDFFPIIFLEDAQSMLVAGMTTPSAPF